MSIKIFTSWKGLKSKGKIRKNLAELHNLKSQYLTDLPKRFSQGQSCFVCNNIHTSTYNRYFSKWIFYPFWIWQYSRVTDHRKYQLKLKFTNLQQAPHQETYISTPENGAMHHSGNSGNPINRAKYAERICVTQEWQKMFQTCFLPVFLQ